MLVAGGVYAERCVSPPRSVLLGSGGRAALTLAGTLGGVQLHTFHPSCLEHDLKLNLEPLGVRVTVHDSDTRVAFDYLHPLARPEIVPAPTTISRTVPIAARNILRFGCVEGDFRVHAHGAVYDPQSGTAPTFFSTNGSSAEHLALVLNADELRRMTARDDLAEAAAVAMEFESACVTVAKDGPAGAHVFAVGQEPRHVPAYPTASVYKIGSGDVFSAAFAHAWLVLGVDAADAADAASRRTADYVEAPTFPLKGVKTPRDPAPWNSASRRILLLGGSATTSGRWLRSEAMRALRSLGLIVLRDEGLFPSQGGGFQDLEFDVVLLLVGRLDEAFREIAAATDYRKPVVAFVDDPRGSVPNHGSGFVAVGDLCSAIHLACWVRM